MTQGAYEIDIWTWEDQGFLFPFPEDLKTFLRRVPTQSVAHGMLDFTNWMGHRVQDCIAYEDTLRCRDDPPQLPAEIHVFVSDNDEVFAGLAFDWRKKVIRLMALWHKSDAMSADEFVELGACPKFCVRGIA